MPRSARIDYPGRWHHVVDRGLARRTVFDRLKSELADGTTPTIVLFSHSRSAT